jgi:hypothetical protein
MGSAARAHVIERFDAARQYAALADLIEQNGTVSNGVSAGR